MASKRACDCCSIRKVKCNGQQPCERCSQHLLDCTYLRVRRKSGPNRLRHSSLSKILKHQRSSSAHPQGQGEPQALYSPSAQDASGLNPLRPPVTLSALRRVLCIYQNQLYGIWPLLNADELIVQLENNPTNPEILTLAAALCAATLSHLNQTVCDDAESNTRNSPDILTANSFAQQARQLRSTFDFTEHVTPNSVLTSYFLHIYYGRELARENTAAFYIREAITFANLLDMHIESTYLNPQWTVRERHTMRKLYFLLMMTERFLCIRYGLPTVLEPIALPSIENEDYPTLVSGFINLIALFYTPGNEFFLKWTAQGAGASLSSKQLLLIQRELELPADIPCCVNDIQRVDIIATQHWMRSLAWKLSIQCGYITPQAQSTCREMSLSYPVQIALDALASLVPISLTAFEVHGPGMESKIYEITDTLADSILCEKPIEIVSGMQVGPRETLKGLSDLLFSTTALNLELRDSLLHKLERVFESASIPVVKEYVDIEDDTIYLAEDSEGYLLGEVSSLLTSNSAAVIASSEEIAFHVV
ncbi:BglR [Penicillium daleae]|uniref:BglR n=1 Tax=Penicillium daleae TaxID=63821 RepID=A0AAD6BZ58_9EURO|nr:BglR [Penicillium daleae]KAJ5439486.1 BglR [Penicillium daleae]